MPLFGVTLVQTLDRAGVFIVVQNFFHFIIPDRPLVHDGETF